MNINEQRSVKVNLLTAYCRIVIAQQSTWSPN